MTEQRDQPWLVESRPVAGQEAANLRRDSLVPVLGAEPPQPTLAGPVPARDPVGDPDRPIGAELDVRRKDVLEGLFHVGRREPGGLRLDAERRDAAAGGPAAEVDDQEPAGEVGRQARAGIEGEPARAAREVRDRGQDPGRLLGMREMPELLAVPGAAVGQILVGHVPADLGTRQHVHEPGPVARVGVVVDREQVAEIVEREFLRIAKAMGDDLEARAVRLAAEDGARAGIGQHPAVLLDAIAAVADREIEPAVVTEHEAVQIVAAECDPGPVTTGEDRPLRRTRPRLAIAVVVPESIEIWNAGHEDVAAAGEDPGHRPVDHPVEPLGEDRGGVGPPVAVGIDEHPHPVVGCFPVLLLVAQKPQVIGEPVLDRLARQVGVDPRGVVAAVVRHAPVLPEGLADEDPALLVDGEGDRIGNVGLGRKQVDGEPLGHAERCGRLRRFR